ncbi:sensor histidine kinase [Pseudomonas sp. GV071]|jgi:signal transduction histidine kinase|uniref:ATP-binding protein n=1 Tax=Pseudomonas sp. GV071 TaxID=2135754 RepID=UPI000D34D2C8|nr:sensor histidine kinase [Pseudomonas sp. GV071]PTQ68415.1 signal transduction histidine kinase [Pseudomonas sp. GV071]
MKSIQRRLSLGLVSVLLVVGLLLAQSSLWLLDLALRRYLESGLRHHTETLLVATVRGPTGLQLNEQRIQAAYEQPFSGRYFRIDFASGTPAPWRSRSLWDWDLAEASEPGLQDELGKGPNEQQLLTYRADYRRYGQQMSITVAQDYSPILASFRQVQYVGLGVGAGALLLILLLQRLTVRNSLRPLERVRQQLQQLQQGQRSALDKDVPLELEPLVTQINHLLAHTEEHLLRSRNALGNLGHALKTPLAVLVSLAERDELKAHPDLQATLREQLQQIEQRLSRELGRARLAGEALPGAQFDCDEELPGLFSTLGMIHNRGLDLTWRAPSGLRLPRDREDLLEMLGNLLDNACKWADSKVQLSIQREGTGYLLWVDDDGPGIDEVRRREVLERGTRLDEQVQGHGLGLGIVRDIVEAWGGRIEMLDSPWGGLRVSVELPNP